MAYFGNNKPFDPMDTITRMLNKNDVIPGKPEDSIKNKIEKYAKQVGGADKFTKKSVMKRVYDAVNCWEKGIELCQQGKGWEAVNLVFRGLVLDRRACQHKFISQGDVTGTTHNLIGNAVRIMQKVANESGDNPEQKLLGSDTCGIKIMALRAHFSSSSGNSKEAKDEIALAIKHALHARSTWKRDTLPVLPYPGWGEGESILDDDVILTLYDIECVIYNKLSLNLSPFAMPEERISLLKKSVETANKALAISPNDIRALMHKAGALWNMMDPSNRSVRAECAEAYRKAAEGPASDDEPLKAVATYQYTMCRLFMYDKEIPTSVGAFKMMHERAKKLEKYSKPIFGKADCMGKQMLKEHRKAYANLPDTQYVSGSFDFYSTEEEKIAKTRAHLKPGMSVTTIGDMSKDEIGKKTANCCSKCGMPAANTKLKMCSKCNMAWYCSAECQKKHWKEHKPECIPREKKPENIAINQQNKEMNEQLNMEQMLKVVAFMYSVYNPDQKVPWKQAK